MRVKVLYFGIVIEDVAADSGGVGVERGDLGVFEALAGFEADSLHVGAVGFMAAVPEGEGLALGALGEEVVEITGVIVVVDALRGLGFALVEGLSGGVAVPATGLEVGWTGAFAGEADVVAGLGEQIGINHVFSWE